MSGVAWSLGRTVGLVIALAAAALWTLSLAPAEIRAEVGRVYAEVNYRGEMKLVGVTVSRGGRMATFDAARLIGVRVAHFRSQDGTNLAVPAGSEPPPVGRRDRLLCDRLLNTGLLNLGAVRQAPSISPRLDGPNATAGLAVLFDRPVVNLPGDDVVVFELQCKANSPPGGDAFHVSPLRFAPGLRAVTVKAFDIPFDDSRALPLAAFDLYRLEQPPAALKDLQTAPVRKAGSVTSGTFRVLAVGIDLSELGYAGGVSVNGLFFQDDAGAAGQVDPVLIAGLPRPEPANLLKQLPKRSLAEAESGQLLQAMLDGPMADIEEILFAERVCGFDHWYANFGYYSASVPEYPPQRGLPNENIPPCFGDGGRLVRLNLRTGRRIVLLDDPKGGVRDPQVHYGGRKILFSYRPGGTPYHHLYEINVDGTGLVQLTDGPFDDIEPAYLPDGGIVFCSSRCRRFVNCYRTPVAHLYRCDADGSNIRSISTNIEHDNTPWVLADGRILYMRWEYVDRSQFCFHHLWTINPDGTGQMIYYGNQFPGIAMLDAKPIPGTGKVVASFSPGHGRPGHMGYITIVDPERGPDDPAGARRLSRNRLFRDPYPISEDCFLVADDSGIHVMNGCGYTELIYRIPDPTGGLTCHEPRPLKPRPRERAIPDQVDLSRTSGRMVLADVYRGRNMDGVKRGEIKKLLVLEQLPKPINFSGGMWPTSVGGTFTLARVLGTVPVEPDGSAHFELPAHRPVFFIALDENDLSVKRMQSFTSVEPGERIGCVGCHEPRPETPASAFRSLLATQRAPSRIEPMRDVPDVLDFPRDIQPILDRHCVRCHNPDRLEGRVDLCGDHSPLFSVSYWTIMQHGLIADGRNEPFGNRPPRTIGSSASRLLDFLDGSHYGVRLAERERKTIRLWIESSAVYAGTYGALGSGMHPVRFPIEVVERRCGSCHGSRPPARPIGKGMYVRFGSKGPALPLVHEFLDLQQIRGRIGYYKFGNARPPQSLCNLTRPDKSLLLRAPLAREAGGLGWCQPAVFSSSDDSDYLAIYERIEEAAERHRKEKRFDMPGFRPNVYYVRMMQRYGILPRDLPPGAPIDIYAADRAYWDSFHAAHGRNHQGARSVSDANQGISRRSSVLVHVETPGADPRVAP